MSEGMYTLVVAVKGFPFVIAPTSVCSASSTVKNPLSAVVPSYSPSTYSAVAGRGVSRQLCEASKISYTLYDFTVWYPIDALFTSA